MIENLSYIFDLFLEVFVEVFLTSLYIPGYNNLLLDLNILASNDINMMTTIVAATIANTVVLSMFVFLGRVYLYYSEKSLCHIQWLQNAQTLWSDKVNKMSTRTISVFMIGMLLSFVAPIFAFLIAISRISLKQVIVFIFIVRFLHYILYSLYFESILSISLLSMGKSETLSESALMILLSIFSLF